MGSLWVCHRIVVAVSVLTYLGCRARYSIMVWISRTVNGYTEPTCQDQNTTIIIPYPSSFGKIRHLPLWVHILLVKIYCLNIASSWPKQINGRSPRFILKLNQPPTFPFLPILSTISLNSDSVLTWYSTKSKTSLASLLGMWVANRIISLNPRLISHYFSVSWYSAMRT